MNCNWRLRQEPPVSVTADGGSVIDTAPDPSFNPDNVDALLGNLTAGSLALALVTAATGKSHGTPASRVAAVLEERVKEARAQLDGSHVA
jgi:hypothetical protein